MNSYLVPSYGKRGYDGVWRATMEVNKMTEYSLLKCRIHAVKHCIGQRL